MKSPKAYELAAKMAVIPDERAARRSEIDA